MIRTAILIDGGFYKKRAKYLWGEKTAEERAREMIGYCMQHINFTDQEEKQLYRIFYYDCAPIRRSVFHPLTKTNVELDKSETYTWAMELLEQLKRHRKVALRLGELSSQSNYNLKPEVTKELFLGKRTLESIVENDFTFIAQQKGVDMKIGLDIASLAYKKQVGQIILISGDSDFVPAAKLARREGIDFVLDPMGANIKDDLFEHVDGIQTFYKMPFTIPAPDDKLDD